MIIIHDSYGRDTDFADNEIIYMDINGIKFVPRFLPALGDHPEHILNIEKYEDTLIFNSYGLLNDDDDEFASLIETLTLKHLELKEKNG